MEDNMPSMGQKSDPQESPNLHQKPTRRGLIGLFSAGVGLVIGGQLKGDRSGEVQAKTDRFPDDDLDVNIELNTDDFIIHGQTPLTVEARRHTVGTSVITDERHLYIRNNLPMPDRAIIQDPDQWSLSVVGVREEREISVAELKTLGLHTVAAVLQCSGNGRAFYTHGPSGSQWSTGAAGCVVWSGVKLSDVIDHLGGVNGEPKYLTSTGGDPLPEGIDPPAVIVERSIPLEKAMRDALLAWEMNGAAISVEHGGPLRLIVPGYFGCNQIKYVTQLALTKQQTRSKIQSSGYRLRPIGQRGSPQYPSMWEMPIKSWLTNESTLFGDRQALRGVAMGGERAVSRVDVSVDGGVSWAEASLVGPDLGPFAWRLFQLKLNLPVGEYLLMSRAYDDQGRVQPEMRVENERGYGHNGWRDHALKVEVKRLVDLQKRAKSSARAEKTITTIQSKEEVRAPSIQAVRGKEVYLKETMPQCGVCHRLDDAKTEGGIGPDLDQLKPIAERVRSAVSQGLGTMPAQKHLTESQLNDLVHYIVEVTK